MSTPIHNIRDGVIPSVGAHAQVTEAHKALWTKLYNLAYDEIFDVASSDGPATQLIADSEARAMQEMASRIQAAFHEPLIKERDQLRQQVANLTFSNNAHRETAEAWRAAAIERDQLRAEVERLNIELGAFRSTQDDLRETRNRAVERMNEATTRAEKAEAELAAERARLDALLNLNIDVLPAEDGKWMLVDFSKGFPRTSEHKSGRAAIDAAMKEDAK